MALKTGTHNLILFQFDFKNSALKSETEQILKFIMIYILSVTFLYSISNILMLKNKFIVEMTRKG